MSTPALRIAALRWEAYALPFARPFVTAGGELRERRGFVVRVRDEAGGEGVGEAAPLPASGGESLAACEARLRAWAASLPGAAVPLPAPGSFGIPGQHRGGGGDLPSALGIVPDSGATPCALHALESALLDLAAQRSGLPLARWLHPAAAAAVPLNATLGATAPPAAAAAAREAAAQGYRTLKLKVGVGGAEADEARLRAVRHAVGAGLRLRIDANGAWTREEALRLLERWAPLELEYVEQPLAPDDLAGAAWLAARSPVPIAADESLRTPADVERVLEARAAGLLVLKPMLLGGPLAALRMARRALAAGVPVVVTTVLEGIYGRLAALHVAAAIAALQRDAGLGDVAPACGLATGALLARDLVAHPPAPARGAWAVPERPGLGCA